MIELIRPPALLLAASLCLSSPLLVSAQSSKKKPITLDVLAAVTRDDTGRGNPIWHPSGKSFAYKEGKKIFLFDLQSKKSRELIDLSSLEGQAKKPPTPIAFAWENRGVRERPYQWTSDGKALLVAVDGDLFLWRESSGKTEQLTATPVAERDPKLSPDGAKVGFRLDHDLYVMDIDSRKTTRLTDDGSPTLMNGKLDWVYPEELALETAWWWAPDSQRIAYLQFDVSRQPIYPHVDHLPITAVAEPQRYPKAGTPNADVRVGVVGITGGRTRWMDFGEIRDHLIARVHWTPDGKSVIAHRLNRIQNHLQVLAADVATGESRLLIEEKDPHWVNLNDDFELLPDGRILLSSERDGGFRHIFLHAADGKPLAQLTRGDWEDTSIACVDKKQQVVYFISSEANPLERHLYRVGFDGHSRQRLSQGEGTFSANFAPGCGAYLETHSSLTSPSISVLRNSDGLELAVWRDRDTKKSDEYDILKTEIHRFKGADGTEFHGRLIKPAAFDPSRQYPVVVMVYGGPHAQSVRNSWAGITWDQVLAHKGFVVWQMDNRGSAGRGHGFESPLFRRFGQTELKDQEDGVKYLKSLGFIDQDRIGIYGWSYGGYMTLYALTHAPNIFKAGVAGAAVTDWRNYDTIYTERYLGLPQENEEGYRASSPVHFADQLQGKLLLVHNIGDDNVLFANALQMMNALELAGKDFDALLYPQKSHGVTGKARNQMLKRMTRFFEESLQAR